MQWNKPLAKRAPSKLANNRWQDYSKFVMSSTILNLNWTIHHIGERGTQLTFYRSRGEILYRTHTKLIYNTLTNILALILCLLQKWLKKAQKKGWNNKCVVCSFIFFMCPLSYLYFFKKRIAVYPFHQYDHLCIIPLA